MHMKQLAVDNNLEDSRPGQETPKKEKKRFTTKGKRSSQGLCYHPDLSLYTPRALHLEPLCMGLFIFHKFTGSDEVPPGNGIRPFVPASVCFLVFGTPHPSCLASLPMRGFCVGVSR